MQALVAGIAGVATYNFYLWLTAVRPAHASILLVWLFAASTVVGKVAFTSPAYVWLGLAIHLLVGIGWAGGYAYLALRQPVLNERWIVSGLLYGIIVYAVMELILLAGNAFRPPPTPTAFLNALVLHTVFFGLPVAYLVKVMQTRRAV